MISAAATRIVMTTDPSSGSSISRKPPITYSNADQQMQREAAPLAIHEGVHDLEHAGHQQQCADEDDAGDGEGDHVEPGDHAQHELGDAEGDEPAPAGARAADRGRML